MKKKFFIKILIIYTFLISSGLTAQSNFFTEGVKLFESKKFDKSKFFFEKDIVFNPTHEDSYLYLAKIFEADEKDDELEINLNNVLMLNPQNEDAVYMLSVLKIKQSDYKKAKELLDQFVQICKISCSKKEEVEKKLKTITSENE